MTALAPLIEALLSPDADPVAAGWQLRELAESATDRGPQLLQELAAQSASLAMADPAVVGGIAGTTFGGNAAAGLDRSGTSP